MCCCFLAGYENKLGALRYFLFFNVLCVMLALPAAAAAAAAAAVPGIVEVAQVQVLIIIPVVIIIVIIIIIIITFPKPSSQPHAAANNTQQAAGVCCCWWPPPCFVHSFEASHEHGGFEHGAEAGRGAIVVARASLVVVRRGVNACVCARARTTGGGAQEESAAGLKGAA